MNVISPKLERQVLHPAMHQKILLRAVGTGRTGLDPGDGRQGRRRAIGPVLPFCVWNDAVPGRLRDVEIAVRAQGEALWIGQGPGQPRDGPIGKHAEDRSHRESPAQTRRPAHRPCAGQRRCLGLHHILALDW